MKNIILGSTFLLSSMSFSQTTELSTLEVQDVLVDEVQNAYSPKRVTKERLQTLSTTDISKALKETSGVYIRDEDGNGLRNNIGLRGTNPDRSKKVVLLEDEVLIGPAPYSAPAAYYTPSMLTTEELNVYKGFSSLFYGPNSIGGAINYKTFSMNDRSEIQSHLSSFNTQIFSLKTGKKIDDVDLQFAYGRVQSDGFKVLDSEDKTPFTQNIALLKLQKPLTFWGLEQAIELRLGYSDENSKETYLGLTETDFKKSAYRRYNSSELDQMKWHHYKVQIEHVLDLNSNIQLKSTLYRHQFSRNWFRLDGFRDATRSIKNVLKNPEGVEQPYYDIITGINNSSSVGANGDLLLAGNDRHYLSQGFLHLAEFRNLWSDTLNSRTKLKILFHQDHINRNHTANYYSMENGHLDKTSDPEVLTTKNKDSADAVSFAYQDHIEVGRFIFLPQFRYESARFHFNDDLNFKTHSRSDSIFLPGLGISYNWSEAWSLKMAMNKAATLAGLDSSGKEAQEESLNQEIGLIWNSEKEKGQFEILYFQNNYSNITGTCTASVGCNTTQLDQQYNGGRAIVSGIESRFAKGFQYNQFWLPFQLNVTYLNARFANEFQSTSAEWGIGQVKNNDPLPYIPEMQVSFIAGIEWKKIKNSITTTYSSSTYDQSVEQDRIVIPAFGLVDYSFEYKKSENLKFQFKTDNLFNKKYATSARPFGYRPGKPQTFSVGINFSF